MDILQPLIADISYSKQECIIAMQAPIARTDMNHI